MASGDNYEGFVELYDVAAEQTVARAPLEGITHIPRAGERIFVPLPGTSKWTSYTVASVEYFLGYTQDSEPSSVPITGSMVQVVLFVQVSK
jgi:hypothetical protein